MSFPQSQIAQIKVALINSISMNKEERDESFRFLAKDCEPNPAFQLALLAIINQPDGNSQLQYQALICMKNSLTRLLQQHRSRSRRVISTGPSSTATNGIKQVGFTGVQQNQQNLQLSEEMRSQIKEQLLKLIEDSNQVILTDPSYEQLTLVAAIFIKYDFPAQWPQLNQWLLKTFELLHLSLPTLQLSDAHKIKRFLSFYLEVMAEQNKKKLTSSKAHFHKVAKDYLKAVAKVWQFFNNQEEQMIMTNDTLQLQNFNETIFEIASKLDKVLIMVVSCGFGLNNLPQEPETNIYVETTAQLIKKLRFFVNVVTEITKLPESDQKQKFYQLMVGQVKTFLKHLSELQSSEALLMFNTLDQYLQIICQVLGNSDIYPNRVNKLAMIALYRVINTNIYNQSTQHDLEPHQNGIGILVSPVKFKNFQPLIEQCSILYMKVLNQPQDGQEDQQDGARKLLELICYRFLSQVDLESWQSDPEYFIENEDEQFLLEYDLQEDCSLNLLAQHLIEKLLQKFYNICYPFIQDIMSQYFSGQLNSQINERVEDALLNLVGIVGKVQREYKVPLDKRLDVCFVLNFIRTMKWANPIFKRRYLLIITHWAKILPKIHFFEIFQSVLQSLDEITEVEAKTALSQVLIYEHCHCVHEMLKEISNWLQRAEQLKKGTSQICQGELPKDIGELRGAQHQFTDSEEDQITLSQLIDSQINYGSVFQKICSKLVPLLDVYKQPNLIWNMINYLSFILEKNCDQPDSTIECLRSLNILKILQGQTQSHVDEAIIDMLKNLLCQCPNSPVILQMCCVLLDYQLARSLNDGNAIQFWLFTMRAVSAENPNIAQLKSLFIKFSGCLTNQQPNAQVVPTINSVANTIIKRDFIYIEFLKVAEEAALLGMFQSQEESSQLTQFTTFKFQQEVENEKLQTNKDNLKSISSDSADSDGEGNLDMSMYEKKTYLIMIPHTLFWSVQSNQVAADFAFGCQRQLVASCCQYLIESSTVKSIPSSSTYFTQLITYLNRMIVVKPQEFMTILGELLQAKNMQLGTWVEEWIKKMDFILSQEASRINCLAIFNLLPHFPAQLVKVVLPEIGRITFQMLEQYLYLKLTNNKSRFHSPSRVNNIMSPQLMKNSNTVRLRTFEKVSQRYEELKRNDQLLDLDLMEHFWQQIRLLSKNMQIEDASTLAQCISDPHVNRQFLNLLNGVSPRYDQYLKDKSEQQPMSLNV